MLSIEKSAFLPIPVSIINKENNMDLSNIYDLPEERFTKYQESPFPDDEIRPGLKEFAKKLL